jgi:hypothetical protein
MTKLVKSFFSLIRLVLLLAALLMGGVAFFRTGGFSDIKFDLNDIKKGVTSEISNFSNQIKTQTKNAKDYSTIQTYILKAKLAILENKDFDSAVNYLETSREMIEKMKADSKDYTKEKLEKLTTKIDDLNKELRKGIYISSQKFEEILLNLEILDKSDK